MNLSIGSKCMERSFSMSAYVYSYLTIGLSLRNYLKMTPHAWICPLVPKLWRGFLPCQLMCTVTSPLNLPWKTTPKRHLICLNLSIGFKVMERSSFMLADVYSDLTIALNKTFMESRCIGQLSRFHCIINYGIQIVSLKKSQSADNIWNFPWAWKFTHNVN